MGLFVDRAEVEIVAASGVLRVSIRPQPRLVSLVITAAIIIGFAAVAIHSWPQSSLLERVVLIAGVVGAVFRWFEQLSGSEEEIEIGERGIRISREIFSWSSSIAPSH
jgi:hypothetical protein